MRHEVIRGVIAIQPCDACDFGAGYLDPLVRVSLHNRVSLYFAR